MSNVTKWDLTDEKISALAQSGIIPHNTPKSQVAVFAEVARRHGLDPFTKEIHLVKYGNTYSTIIGIQGMRGRAADTGLHAGTDAPKFDLQPNGAHFTMAQLMSEKRMPITCSVTVYKIIGGVRVPFEATVGYVEFAQHGGKWTQMPYNMIAKVAESHALRKAFPRSINGLYLDEEMQQATRTIEVEEKLPALTKDHEAWKACVNALQGAYTIADIRKRYEVSEEVKAELVAAASEQ